MASTFFTHRRLTHSLCIASVMLCVGCQSEFDDAVSPSSEATPTPIAATPTPPPPTSSPDPSATPTPMPVGTAPPTPSPQPLPTEVSAEVQAIFDDNCTGCHSNDDPFNTMLNLSSAIVSYENLVNQVSSAIDNASQIRVIPGNATDSYLIKKLEGADDIIGVRMPRGLDPLSNAQINTIKTWIDELPSSKLSAEPVHVLTSKTEQKSHELVFAMQLSSPIDAEFISNDSVLAYWISADDKSLIDNSHVRLTTQDTRLKVTIDLENAPNYDSIELILNSELIAPVLDTIGRVMDGDQDGLEGGAFTIRYDTVSDEK